MVDEERGGERERTRRGGEGKREVSACLLANFCKTMNIGTSDEHLCCYTVEALLESSTMR